MGVIRDVLLAVGLVLLVPFVIIAIGAPLALFIRLILSLIG